MTSNFCVKLLTANAKLPVRGSAHAAGYDVFSASDYIIKPQGKELVSTGIAIAIPLGCYARVAPRSSLAWKHHIDVGAGVIDYDYRGELKLILYNLSPTDEFVINKGDRVAQIILEKIYTPDILEVTELPATDRGVNGFGSTGK